MAEARPVLIGFRAYCHSCSKERRSQDAMRWAKRHVRREPGHHVEVSLDYSVRWR